MYIPIDTGFKTTKFNIDPCGRPTTSATYYVSGDIIGYKYLKSNPQINLQIFYFPYIG